MIDPVLIQFVAGGVRDVERALDTLDKRLARFERDSGRAATSGAQSRTRAAEGEAQRREKAYGKLAKEVERFERQQALAAEKQEKAKERAAQRTARQLEQIHRRSSEMAGRYAAQQARAEIREAERAARERVRIAERSAQAEAHARQRFARVFGSSVARNASGIMSGAAGLMGIGGGFAIADTVRNRLGAEREAVELSNSAYIPGQRARPDPKSILSRASAVQVSTNIGKAELLKGWREYVKLSSDFEGGEQNLSEFAKLSKASGTDFTELMKTAGSLRVQNQNLGSAEMMNLLRGIIGQGKLGAVEFEDLAAHAGKVTASSGMYEGSQALNQRRLLGLAQVARQTTGDAAEAATVVERFSSDISTHREKLAMHGITTTNAQGELLDPAIILARALHGTNGDLGKLQHLGFNRESIKLAQALLPTFKNAGGGGFGAEAVYNEVSKFENAGYSKQDVDKDFAAVMQTNAEKFEGAVQKIEDQLEGALAPAIQKVADKMPALAPKLEALITATGTLAEWFVDNPFKGIGAVMAGAVAKDIAAAQIGEFIKQLLAGGTGGGGVRGPAGGGTGVGQTVAVAEIGAAVGAYGQNAKNVWNARGTGTEAGDKFAANLIGGIRGGRVTPGDVSGVMEETRQTLSPWTILKQEPTYMLGGVDTMLQDAGVLAKGHSITGGDDAATIEARRQEAIAIRTHSKEMDAAFKELTGRIRDAAKAAGDAARSIPINERTGTGH